MFRKTSQNTGIRNGVITQPYQDTFRNCTVGIKMRFYPCSNLTKHHNNIILFGSIFIVTSTNQKIIFMGNIIIIFHLFVRI